MTASTRMQSTSPEALALEACVGVPGPKSTNALADALKAPEFAWGSVIELAIENKVLCLLAHTLQATELASFASHRIVRFLARSLRANKHATGVYRSHAAEIAAAASAVVLRIAVTGGIVAEQSLYGGTGAREFSDIDLLTAPDNFTEAAALLTSLGYTPRRGRATTFTRTTTDQLIPLVAVDLSCQPPGIPPGQLPAVLERCESRPILDLPGAALAVLSPRDHDRHLTGILAAAEAAGRPRLAARADQARLRSREPRIAASLNGIEQ